MAWYLVKHKGKSHARALLSVSFEDSLLLFLQCVILSKLRWKISMSDDNSIANNLTTRTGTVES
jgi:hypothetical protein